ncbi:hypothetical protein HB950_01495 [Listeria welshimeri]|nr:hypothetical protein [Listeria welshimeri]MBC1670983.1 hypothetical protein [Listeria welshimeri]
MEKFLLKFGFLTIIITFTFDFLNLPSNLSNWLKWNWLNVTNINWALFNILVVIFLYILTFKNIEKKGITKERNKQSIGRLLLEKCYIDCITNGTEINKKHEFITQKNSTPLKNIPFINEKILISFVNDGQLTQEEFQHYINVKSKFTKFVGFILFKNETSTPEQKKLVDKYIQLSLNELDVALLDGLLQIYPPKND